MAAELTAAEVNKLYSFRSRYFVPEGDIPSIKRQLGRTLGMREENWIIIPRGTNPRFTTATSDTPIKIMLVGVGGVGKSRLGNLLVGDNVFKTGNSTEPVTEVVSWATSDFEGQKIVVFDTPGYILKEIMEKGASFAKKTSVHAAIKEGLMEIGDGIHVVIFVMSGSNQRTSKLEIEIMQEARFLNPQTLQHCMIVETHCQTKYAHGGIAELKENVAKSPEIVQLFHEINERVVLVELGSLDLESCVGANSLDAYSYECEKQQARKMVFSMAASVVDGNRRLGIPIMYSRRLMEVDLQEATLAMSRSATMVTVGGARHYSNPSPNFTVDQSHNTSFNAHPNIRGAECFPSMATVYTTHGKKAMKELKLDDEVLVVDKHGLLEYEPVFMFTHASPDELSQFVSITTEGGEVLCLSEGHLLPIGEPSTLKPARDVMVGDLVYCHDGIASDIVPVKVMAVGAQQLNGLYCPHTPSGCIVVDSIVASCYTDILPAVIAHGTLIPVRVLHRVLPAEWFTRIFSYDTMQGMLATLSFAAQATNTLLYG